MFHFTSKLDEKGSIRWMKFEAFSGDGDKAQGMLSFSSRETALKYSDSEYMVMAHGWYFREQSEEGWKQPDGVGFPSKMREM